MKIKENSDFSETILIEIWLGISSYIDDVKPENFEKNNIVFNERTEFFQNYRKGLGMKN